MSLITGRVVFSSGAVIYAADQNTNDGTIWNDYNGNITNTNISGSAAIAYSKLNLATSIVNADISASAAIVASKLDLTSPGAIGSTSAGTGAFSTLKVGTTNQGDILYDNGTSLVRLTPGTSGQFLKTQGAAANPIWSDPTVAYAAGSILLAAGDTERTHTSDTSYTKVKEIVLVRAGTISTAFEIKVSGGVTGSGRIYKNGVAVGTEQTTTSSSYGSAVTEDLSGWVAGDLCQLYIKTSDGAQTVTIRNFRLYATLPTVETVITD